MKTTDQRYAIGQIRAALGIRRLDPRRLYLVNDGAYHWIGDRADLKADLARKMALAHRDGTRPDLVTRDERDEADARWGDDWYSHACSDLRVLASSCGCGLVSIEDLPEDWQDGSALGPISPLCHPPPHHEKPPHPRIPRGPAQRSPHAPA